MPNPYLVDGLVYRRVKNVHCQDCEAGQNGHCSLLPKCGPYSYEVDTASSCVHCIATGLCNNCKHAGHSSEDEPCKSCREDKYAIYRRLGWEKKDEVSNADYSE